MKASELMIGDLVNDSRITTQFRPSRIVNIDGNRCCVGLYYINDEDENIIGRYAKYIEPIHLTEEILKANGFTKTDGWTYELYIEDGDWYFVIRIYDEGEFVCVDVAGGVFSLCYVHTLQHAFRLCGLNDLADNFKIE